MENKKWCILGTDSRSKCIRNMYGEEKKDIVSYDMADIIIGPVPFSKDNIMINGESITCNEIINVLSNSKKRLYTGAISSKIREVLINNKIEFYDIMQDESIAILNAIPTSEGAIAIAMKMTEFTLHGSNILVLGYGKVGKILSKMLFGIGAHVYCEARNKKDIAFIQAMGYNSVSLEELDNYLPDMNVIFNTIPSLILDENRLKLLNKKCCLVDIASNPGGIDFLKAKELEINTSWSLALPSKVAPCTAAKYLKTAIDKIENMKG